MTNLIITNAIINFSVLVFMVCSFAIIVNRNIKKSIPSWIFLIGMGMSSISMFANQSFYSTSFAAFAFFAAMGVIYITNKLFKRGEL